VPSDRSDSRAKRTKTENQRDYEYLLRLLETQTADAR